MQTGSSGTLIGWKSGQTTFVPLWDRMEGAWLRTLRSDLGGSIFFWRAYHAWGPSSSTENIMWGDERKALGGGGGRVARSTPFCELVSLKRCVRAVHGRVARPKPASQKIFVQNGVEERKSFSIFWPFFSFAQSISLLLTLNF
jgi:hypothetical protein